MRKHAGGTLVALVLPSLSLEITAEIADATGWIAAAHERGAGGAAGGTALSLPGKKEGGARLSFRDRAAASFRPLSRRRSSAASSGGDEREAAAQALGGVWAQ